VSSHIIFEASMNAEINKRCQEEPFVAGKWEVLELALEEVIP
jgi:hypothetical protein